MDDKDTGTASSAEPTEEITDVAPGAEDSAVDQQAESSPAPDGAEEDFDAMSAVQTVVEARMTPNEGSPPEEEEPAAAPEGEAAVEEQPEERSEGDDEFKDVPFHKHPRFKKLIAERDSLRVEAKKAEEFRAFLDEAGVDEAKAADAVKLAALMERDPAEAWKQVQPLMQKLLRDAGVLLPDDLREQVAAGQLSAQHAQEISKARAQSTTMSAERERAQKAEETRRAKEAQTEIQTSVAGWESKRAAADPGFGKLIPHVKAHAQALIQEFGPPRNAQEAVACLTEAERRVRELLAPAPKPPVDTLRGSGRVATPRRPAEDVSILDIVKARGQAV